MYWILDDLAVSTAMVLITVALHGIALSWLGRLLKVEYIEEARHHVGPLSLRALAFTQAVVLALFALHGLEIWLYAFVYGWIGAIGDFSSALYFSTISYAAIGYTDVAIDPRWRLVGAIEGINGLLLLGWSTAFFVGFLTRLGRR
jgi:hypothetical protein